MSDAQRDRETQVSVFQCEVRDGEYPMFRVAAMITPQQFREGSERPTCGNTTTLTLVRCGKMSSDVAKSHHAGHDLTSVAVSEKRTKIRLCRTVNLNGRSDTWNTAKTKKVRIQSLTLKTFRDCEVDTLPTKMSNLHSAHHMTCVCPR